VNEGKKKSISAGNREKKTDVGSASGREREIKKRERDKDNDIDRKER